MKKCPYCQNQKVIISADMPIDGFQGAYLSIDAYLSGNHLVTDVDSYDEGGFITKKLINYCPMCGRKLNHDRN